MTSKKVSIPLEFGSMIHLGLEHQFNFSSPRKAIQAVIKAYKKLREKASLNSSERDTLEYLCALAEVTFPLYCEYWKEDDERITWVGREERFQIQHTVMLPDGPREILLRGMRDGLFRVNGRLGLFETKTKSRISEMEIISGLRSDMQTLFYCFVTLLETGEMPKTIKYNIIRRSDLYRRQSGREPIISYTKRIQEEIEAAPEKYFSRYKVELSKHDIENFQRQTLDPLLRRFIHWWDHVKKNPCGVGRFESPYHSLNCGSLIGKYGKADMWELMVNKNTRPYYRRTAVFPELEDSGLDIR